ncbi:Na(+)/H(+) exchange regulatory cofactor NHE-RF1-like [Penaeus japonicus]|uniref:Na(+)/H(+) exchange regulatory cofactor NHE-RF1-like n=1 Tax=Penaeus japonicus TaxID=27405 RepID=UPI001C70D1E2|nr:Na(+)/H(+) exchange regulatory cofactor NHE-RF1-like [Penaeus japonicus]
MSDIPDNAPAPRLCIITKWPDFEGYGFNLHAEKSKPGQYIGKVDAASPAEMAGLLEGDRIIEVNGVNIANENHKQVVQRIKAVTNETRLLVLDPEADKYYKSKNIVVRGSQSNVVTKSSVRAPPSPPTPEPPATNGHHHHHHDDGDARSVSSAASSSATSEASTQPQVRRLFVCLFVFCFCLRVCLFVCFWFICLGVTGEFGVVFVCLCVCLNICVFFYMST